MKRVKVRNVIKYAKYQLVECYTGDQRVASLKIYVVEFDPGLVPYLRGD